MTEAGSRRLTLALAVLTFFVIALSLPSSLREAYERGGLYLFSREFLEHLPSRLTGPGRFRFLFQPAFAALLGVAAGRADARAEKPSYLYALLFHGKDRRELVRASVDNLAKLLLMGILLDSICQWLILGSSYPGAALVVGPVLIAVPYAMARTIVNRTTKRAPHAP